MSPMGEPFFGRTPGEDGLVVWFQQADRNHDGSLSPDEMAADAQRFFETLDLNHDGEIDPDEIAHYENVVASRLRRGPLAPVAAPAAAGQQEAQSGGWGGHGGHRGGGRRHGGGGASGQGSGGGFGGGDDEARAGRYGLLEIPEPVASADADFNRGVSTDEFRRAAIERFQLLDVDHKGRLTLPQLESIRDAAASDAKHAGERPSSTPAEPNDGDQPPM